MSSTFTLCKPIVAPGAITHAVSCNLIGPKSQDLVVVRHNWIEVFALASSSGDIQPPSASGTTDRPLLHRKMDKQIVARLPGWTRDALLLAYPHSKLSLCVWDVGTLELVVLSTWTQDEEVVGVAAMAAAKAAALEAQAHAAQAVLKGSMHMHMDKSYMVPMLRVDPLNRCAALITFDNFLNIFDLSPAAAASAEQAHVATQTDASNGQACHSGMVTSTTGTRSFYTTAASAMSTTAGSGLVPSLSHPSTYTLESLQLGTITDMQFLHGFEDPTLLILHEKRHTWTNRAAVKSLNRQELTAVTFHPREAALSVVGRMSGVSCDTHTIHPIPMHLGGALIFAKNTIWHWNNNALNYALSLNALGGEEGRNLAGAGKMAHVDQSTCVLSLDQSYAVFLHTYTDISSMFIVCKNGESYLLNMAPSVQGVRHMQIDSLGMLSVPQGIVKVVNSSAADLLMQYTSSSSPHALAVHKAPSFLFAFSRMGPSLLLEYRHPTDDERSRQEEEVREQENEIVVRRQKEAGAEQAMSGTDASLDAEEEKVEMTNQRAGHDFHFFVRDRLTCSSAAPMHDLSLGHLLPPEEDAALEAEDQEQALAYDAAKHVESDEEERADQSLELSELEKRWRDKESRSRVIEVVQLSGFESSGAVVLSNEGIVPDIIAKIELEQQCIGCWTLRGGEFEPAEEDDNHAFLLVATPQSTLVFRIGETVSQVLDPTHALDQAYTEFLQSQGIDVEWADVKGSKEALANLGAYAVLTPPLRARLDAIAAKASQHPFSTARTVAAADLSVRREGQNSTSVSASDNEVQGVVQVLSDRVRLVQNGQLVEERLLAIGNSAAVSSLEYVSAQFESPYIALHLNDDSIRLVTVRANAAGVLFLGQEDVPTLGAALYPVSAFALFKDETQTRALNRFRSSAAAVVVAPPIVNATPIVSPDHYVAVARNACVEIYSLPSVELVYSMPRFSVGRRVLHHAHVSHEQNIAGSSNWTGPTKPDDPELCLADADLPSVTDMFLGVVSDAPEALPVLMAFLDNGDLLAYQSFAVLGVATTSTMSDALELRWVREQTPLLSRPFLSTTDNPPMGSVMASEASLQGGQYADKTYRDVFGVGRSRRSVLAASSSSRFQRLTHLGASDSSQNGRRTGVIIAGTKPLCVFADRGALRMHAFVVNWRARGEGLPFEEEEDVESDFAAADPSSVSRKKEGLVCSAPFHYSFQDDSGGRVRSFGLVYFDTRGTMHIAKLHPSAPLPCHALHFSEGKMRARGLASPLLATLDCAEAASLSPSIGVSPALVDYDSSALLRRTVHLGATPRFLARHTPTSTTVIVVSRRVRIPSSPFEPARSVPVYSDRFELLMFHSRSWDLVGRYDGFDSHEVVLTATAVTLHKQVYIAVGTSVYQGEDVARSGQIILLEIFFSVEKKRAEDGDNAASFSGGGGVADATDNVKLLKVKVHHRAENFPVSKMVAMSPDMLVAGVGSKIILYAHNGRQLVARAFFDGNVWITSLSCHDNFILYGDAKQGLHVLCYDGVLRTLTRLGMSHERFHVNSCDFLVDMMQMSLVAGDQQGNINVIKFDPNAPPVHMDKTIGAGGHAPNPNSNICTSTPGNLGYKLNLHNDLYMGEHSVHMKRMRLHSHPTSTASTLHPMQTALLVGSYTGGMAQLLPCDQLSFHCLTALSVQMSRSLSRVVGIHPLDYHQFQPADLYHPQLSKKVLDLSLLLHFPGLDVESQCRLARLIGTTPAQIVDSLMRIAWATQMH